MADTNSTAGPRVAWIHVAPIKALAIQELQEVRLDRLGVENDRRFCIVDCDGNMLNAKRVQRFVAVRPHFDDEVRRLALEMPDGSRVKGAVDLGSTIAGLDLRALRARARDRRTVGRRVIRSGAAARAARPLRQSRRRRRPRR